MPFEESILQYLSSSGYNNHGITTGVTMAKISLKDTRGGYDLSSLNSNFQKLEQELQDKVLYRDNPDGEPNQLENNIDANGYRINNLPAPVAPTDIVRLRDLAAFDAGNDTIVIVSVEESQILGDGQTTVILSDITTAQTAFYISGDGTDNGRLLFGKDYDIISDTTIELAATYPAGTTIVALQNEATADVEDVLSKSGRIIAMTLSEAVAYPHAPEGQVIQITDRGNGLFEAVSATDNTPDGAGVIQGYGDTAWRVIVEGKVDLLWLGAKPSLTSDSTEAFQNGAENFRSFHVRTKDGDHYSIEEPIKLKKIAKWVGDNRGSHAGSFFSGVSKTTNNTVTITNPQRPTQVVDCLFYTDGEWEDGTFTQASFVEDISLRAEATSPVDTAFYVIQGGVNLRNMSIFGFDHAIRGDEMWSMIFEKVVTDGKMSFSNGTSVDINQCACSGGFEFDNIRYSSLQNCSSDYSTNPGYRFKDTVSTVMIGCGTEHTRGASDDEGDAISFDGGNIVTVESGYFVADAHPTRAVFSVVSDKIVFKECKNVFVDGTTPTFDNYDLVVTGNGASVVFDRCQFGNNSYDDPKIRFNTGVTNSFVYVYDISTDTRPKIYYSDGTGATLVRRGVIDGGSNANGTFTKFDDGTMICSHVLPKAAFNPPADYLTTVQNINWYRSEPVKWLFPEGFISKPILDIQPVIGGLGSRVCWARTTSSGANQLITGDIQLVSVEPFFDGGSAYNNLEEVHVQATGRWK